MSEKELTPEEVLLLAQAALAPGAPVKVRSYVKHSTKGKAVVVRQAIRGATGGTGRTPINPPTAQTTPVVSNKAIQSETAAARAGVAVQKAALAAASKQAAAALKLQKQQAAAKKKQQKKTTAKKAPASKTAAQPKPPKTPKLGNLGALGALGGGGHGGGLGMLRGRRGRLFPGSKVLSGAMARSRKAKEAKNKDQSRSSSVNRLAHPNIQPRVAGAEHHIANSEARLNSAHRALEAAAAYRRSHGHGLHSVDSGFHEKLAGEIIKHEAKRLAQHLHMSNSSDPDIILTQEALRIEGYPVEITGQMNDETADALAVFLLKEGIDIDASYE